MFHHPLLIHLPPLPLFVGHTVPTILRTPRVAVLPIVLLPTVHSIGLSVNQYWVIITYTQSNSCDLHGYKENCLCFLWRKVIVIKISFKGPTWVSNTHKALVQPQDPPNTQIFKINIPYFLKDRVKKKFPYH